MGRQEGKQAGKAIGKAQVRGPQRRPKYTFGKARVKGLPWATPGARIGPILHRPDSYLCYIIISDLSYLCLAYYLYFCY